MDKNKEHQSQLRYLEKDIEEEIKSSPNVKNILKNGDHTYTKSHKVVKQERRDYIKVSNETRKKIIDSIENGLCTRKTAASTFGVSHTNVIYIYKRFLENGTKEQKKRTVFSAKKLQQEHVSFVLSETDAHCSDTLQELKDKLHRKFGVEVSMTTIHKILKASKYRYINKQRLPEAAINAEIIEKRKTYCEYFLKLEQDQRLVIFLDETVFKVTMPRSRERAQLITPTLRSRNKTVVAAMTSKELLYFKILDGAGNSAKLFEYLTELISLLETIEINNAIVVMNNASFHHCEEIENLIVTAGHELLFLPEDSPSLNPIESIFSKWTAHVRSMETSGEDHLEKIISSFYGVMTESTCSAYYQHVVNEAKLSIDGDVNRKDETEKDANYCVNDFI